MTAILYLTVAIALVAGDSCINNVERRACVTGAMAKYSRHPAELPVAKAAATAVGQMTDARGPAQESGTAAIAELQALLSDETRLADHRAALDCLVRAGGTAAIPVLEGLLRDERTFWNNLGMNLDGPAKLPAVRTERLAAILHHLAVFGYRDPHHLVRDVRDRFRDHPVLCAHARPVITAAQTILAPE